MPEEVKDNKTEEDVKDNKTEEDVKDNKTGEEVKDKDLEGSPAPTYQVPWYQTTLNAVPHKCPICEGRGNVAGGFYQSVGTMWTSTTSIEVCRACWGSGIIWGMSNR
jgi:hypothetical protein